MLAWHDGSTVTKHMLKGHDRMAGEWGSRNILGIVTVIQLVLTCKSLLCIQNLGQTGKCLAGVKTAARDSEADYLPNAFSPIAALSCSTSSTYIVSSQLLRQNLGFSNTSQYSMPTKEYLRRHQNLSLVLLVLEENVTPVANNSGGTNSESCFFKKKKKEKNTTIINHGNSCQRGGDL